MQKLIDSGIILALLTATLYSVGTAEYNGFLAQLYLDRAILDRDLHQTLYSGFISAATPVIIGMMFIALAQYLYVHIILDVVLTEFAKSKRFTKWLVKVIKFFRGKKNNNIALNKKKKFTIDFILVTAIGIAYIFFLATFENKGVESGKKLLAQLISNQEVSDRHPLITILIDNNEMILTKIVCGSRNCAGYDSSSKRIYYFPQGTFSYAVLGKPKILSNTKAKVSVTNKSS